MLQVVTALLDQEPEKPPRINSEHGPESDGPTQAIPQCNKPTTKVQSRETGTMAQL